MERNGSVRAGLIAILGFGVTEDRPDVFPPAPDFGRLLLDAKLSVPQRRRGVVDRAELIRTARSSDCRVVGVTAPAGYGNHLSGGVGVCRGSACGLGLP